MLQQDWQVKQGIWMLGGMPGCDTFADKMRANRATERGRCVLRNLRLNRGVGKRCAAL